MQLAKLLRGALLLQALSLAPALTGLHAATFFVTNTNDAGSGSLRQAILAAEGAPGADVVDATGINGTISLATKLPDISTDITINGPGPASVSGTVTAAAQHAGVDSPGCAAGAGALAWPWLALLCGRRRRD